MHLAQLRGREVILFFYTQDETPQSTHEASDLRDEWAELSSHGAFVIGVSRDTPRSHVDFAQSHRLPFKLVSDETGELR